MSSRAWLVPAGVLAIGALVYLGGVAVAGRSGATAVAVGVGMGCAFQLLFLSVARLAFEGKPLAAYGVGMLGRLILLGVAMLVVVPLAGVPAAPALLSLVTVLFATTLLEPVALAARTRDKR